MLRFYILYLIPPVVTALLQYLLQDIWSAFISYHSTYPILLQVIYPFLLVLFVYWTAGIFFLVVRFPGLRKLQNKSSTIELSNCVCNVLFNQYFVLLPSIYLFNYLLPISFSPTIPSTSFVIYTLIKVILAGEIFYYHVHRLLHHPKLYQHIHNIHHH